MRGAMIRNTPRRRRPLNFPRRHAGHDQGSMASPAKSRGPMLIWRLLRAASRAGTGGQSVGRCTTCSAAAGSSPGRRGRRRVTRFCGTPPRRSGVARAGRALGRDQNRRQGASAARPASSQSGREEADLRPFAGDASAALADLLTLAGFAVSRVFERQPQRTAERMPRSPTSGTKAPVLLCTEIRAARAAIFSSAIRSSTSMCPGNPMAIEQRIGRIDRIGQPSGGLSCSTSSPRGTLEDQLLALLEEKISMFETGGRRGRRHPRKGLGEERDFPGTCTRRVARNDRSRPG